MVNANVNFSVAIDSKHLKDSLSTWCTPTYKSIRGDLSPIRDSFETRRAHPVIWFPGTLNSADILKKFNSALTEVVAFLLLNGFLPINRTTSEPRNFTRSLGWWANEREGICNMRSTYGFRFTIIPFCQHLPSSPFPFKLENSRAKLKKIGSTMHGRLLPAFPKFPHFSHRTAVLPSPFIQKI